MRVLSAADVRRALPMPRAVEAMKRAFAALSAGRAVVPQRLHLASSGRGGVSLIMPALVDPEREPPSLAVKVVSLFDGNRARGLARIQAAVLVLDPHTGRPEALLEGATLTAIRTAAASGAATDFLARPDSRAVALFGAGVQARAHLDAMRAVRPIERVVVFSRTRAKAEAMVDELRPALGSSIELRVAASPGEAVGQADIVCCATTSKTPVFDDVDLRPGTHVNAVGSYTPEAREIPPETIVRAAVVVDDRAAAWEEAGDLIQPLRAGLITRDHVRADLGELANGQKLLRTDDVTITVFKSVGLGVQDAVAAQAALEAARELNLGTTCDFL